MQASMECIPRGLHIRIVMATFQIDTPQGLLKRRRALGQRDHGCRCFLNDGREIVAAGSGSASFERASGYCSERKKEEN